MTLDPFGLGKAYRENYQSKTAMFTMPNTWGWHHKLTLHMRHTYACMQH